MRLVENWRAVLRHSYAVHCWAIAIVCEFMNVLANFWTLFDGLLPISRAWFAGLGLTFGLLGWIGRFLPQPKISGDKDNG